MMTGKPSRKAAIVNTKHPARRAYTPHVPCIHHDVLSRLSQFGIIYLGLFIGIQVFALLEGIKAGHWPEEEIDWGVLESGSDLCKKSVLLSWLAFYGTHPILMLWKEEAFCLKVIGIGNLALEY
jgi:hypothetical protein